jgi:trehalose 6-phosphate phosphatase
VKNLLSARSRPLLRELAARRTLLAFDFDGTLAPIVASRDQARLSPRTVRLLRAVADGWPCAVISGRSRADVQARLGGAHLIAVVGNHGAEAAPPLPGAAGWWRRVRAWRRRLDAELAEAGGIDVEDKGLSLAVHVQGASARLTAWRALLDLPGVRIVGGKRVLNAVVRGAPDKGEALARVARGGRFERVLFVGDDATDEDVFRRPSAIPLVGVSVGRRRRSSAPFFLARQGDVATLLSVLERLRRDGPGPGQWSGSPQRLQ